MKACVAFRRRDRRRFHRIGMDAPAAAIVVANAGVAARAPRNTITRSVGPRTLRKSHQARSYRAVRRRRMRSGGGGSNVLTPPPILRRRALDTASRRQARPPRILHTAANELGPGHPRECVCPEYPHLPHQSGFATPSSCSNTPATGRWPGRRSGGMARAVFFLRPLCLNNHGAINSLTEPDAAKFASE